MDQKITNLLPGELRRNLEACDALTGNTSYVLIQRGERVAGCDNQRFWHMHPLGSADQHIPCDEPTPGEVVAQLATACSQL